MRTLFAGALALCVACGEDDDTAGDAAVDANEDAAEGDATLDAVADAASPDGALPDATADAGQTDASYCDPAVGVVEPLPVCSADDPCTRVLFGGDPIDEPTSACVCSSEGSERPAYDDGAPLTFTGEDGLERCACLYTPPGASVPSPRPLLVFFHGSGSSARTMYMATSLRTKAIDADLSGDAERPGFALLAIQSRNLHWPTGTAEDGPKHDFFHRDLAMPSTNPDLAAFDRFVDDVVEEGAIDPDRIYTTGWSNGGRFAQLVAIARHDVATPGGSRVAAAAIYSGTDPFNGLAADPSCALATYPTSDVPIMLVGRACDILPCDEAQAEDLRGEGLELEAGDVMATWVDDLRSRVGSSAVERLIVTGLGTVTTMCTGAALCSRGVALTNHLHWPDGVADNSEIDHEPAMLSFLRAHPLP